jgi:hypothetical protein
MATQTTRSRRIPWIALVLCGGISWGVNVAHALGLNGGDPSAGQISVALMFGTAPVVVAALMSHMLAQSGTAGAFKRTLIFLIFIGAMGLSMKAQAETVEPYSGPYLNLVFPLMLDLATLVALHSIMGAPAVRRAARHAKASDIGAARPDIAPVARPTAPAPEVTPIGHHVRSDVRPPADVRSDIETMSASDRARLILAEDPDISGAELGRRLGVDPRHGSRLKKEVGARLDAEAANESGHPQLRAVSE